MRTSKPIATISYNTQEFLLYKLNEMIKSHTISDYIFINHFAEEDERKNHIHLWLKPNKLLDTMDIQAFLTEVDSLNPTKPLKCIDFVTSNVDDWILYGMHLEPYLKSKNEERQYHYTKDDFIFYDEDSFEYLYNHALKGSDWAKNAQIRDILQDPSINKADLIDSGILPLTLAGSLNAYMHIKKGRTFRDGRKGHEDEIQT